MKNFWAQFLAASTKNLVGCVVGMTFAFITTGLGVTHNSSEGISLNDTQVGWLCGFLFGMQPLGSLLSGPIVEVIGRKHFLMLIHLPFVAGWTTVYCATTPSVFIFGFALLGFSVGLQEAPTKTYAGEVCEPAYRGILSAVGGVTVNIGYFLAFLLGAYTHWKIVPVIAIAISVFAVMCTSLIPESPHWLVSRGRLSEAEDSLCWLRGWVQPDQVQDEFKNLIAYSANSRKRVRQSEPQVLNNVRCQGPLQTLSAEKDFENQVEYLGDQQEEESLWSKSKALLEPETCRPLFLMFGLFLTFVFGGSFGTTVYVKLVVKELNFPVKYEIIPVCMGVLYVCSSVTLICTIRSLGKRRLLLLGCGGGLVCSSLLSLYSFAELGPEFETIRWIPVVLYLLHFFLIHVTVLSVPWIMLSEIFPYRTRGIATGIASSSNHVLCSVVGFYFLQIHTAVSLGGIYAIMSGVLLSGFIFICLFVPETEGRTLEEIEQFFREGKCPNKEQRSLPRTRQHLILTV